MFLEDEAFSHSVVYRREHGNVVILHDQQADRLFVRSGLRPGDGFKQLVEGAETAGQGDVSIRQFVHARFAGMHIGHHFHAGDADVRKRLRVHGWNDDTNHFAARFDDAVCHRAHETGLAAAVN